MREYIYNASSVLGAASPPTTSWANTLRPPSANGVSSPDPWRHSDIWLIVGQFTNYQFAVRFLTPEVNGRDIISMSLSFITVPGSGASYVERNICIAGPYGSFPGSPKIYTPEEITAADNSDIIPVPNWQTYNHSFTALPSLTADTTFLFCCDRCKTEAEPSAGGLYGAQISNILSQLILTVNVVDYNKNMLFNSFSL